MGQMRLLGAGGRTTDFCLLLSLLSQPLNKCLPCQQAKLNGCGVCVWCVDVQKKYISSLSHVLSVLADLYTNIHLFQTQFPREMERYRTRDKARDSQAAVQ